MIRTSLSPGEKRALRRLAEGKHVVECGALLGGSAVELSTTAVSVVSIDKHEGYGASTLRSYFSNLDRFATRRNIRPLVGDVRDLVTTVAGQFGFVDLTGSYELTRSVLQAIRCPVVAVHDLGRVGCVGVEPAIRDAGFRIVGQVDTLAICERRI